MEGRTLISPRVLIVEDEASQLRGVSRDLATIPVGIRQELGIDYFRCDLASNVDEAERFFAQANDLSYELLLLDLGIPRSEGGPVAPENGLKLLRTARENGSAKEVIVLSVWHVVEMVSRTFRDGAIDFIPKPYATEILQARVIECWKRLLDKESKRLLDERISYLVPYAEKGLAHRFTACFSSLVKTVTDNAEDIENYIYERYGLDRQRDSHDFLFKCLRSQEESVAKARREWLNLQTFLLPNEESSKVETLETLLKKIQQDLLPCLVVKNVTLEFISDCTTEILTFQDDVHIVLKEIIAGAVDMLPDHPETHHTIQVKVESGDGQAKVIFIDQFKSILGDDAQDINGGTLSHKLSLWFQQTPHPRFERAWGLSVAQHIAMRGGGRLDVKPQAHGNVVTYFVPLA